MDMKNDRTLSVDKFNKCGELYRSPIINDKQYMFLSCIYCKDISWELNTFLQHLDNTHHAIVDTSSNLYKEDTIIENNLPNIKNDLVSINSPSAPRLTSSTNCENDPLDESHYEYNELLPISIKIERAELCECTDINSKPEFEFNNKQTDYIIDKINSSVIEHNANDNYKPYKIASEDENEETAVKYINEDSEHDDDNDDLSDIAHNFQHAVDNTKASLKAFTKNREFIKVVINAYQKQKILWDTAYKRKKSNATEKQEAFKNMLEDINHKFKINATAQQIERIIKRLKLKFAHQLRLKDKGESNKTLWFFELLNFLQPHLEDYKMKSGVCKQLNDKQILALIKLIRENECFWNENNIYHTSVINKQEILKRLTIDFATMCDLKDFNVDVMQNTIDEVIEMAREENADRTQHIKIDDNDEYKSGNKFHKEIQFLLPHVGPFKCKYCSKTFIDIYAYKFHMSRHEGTKPFKCMECPRELTHKKEFVCHLRRHTKECPFQCNSCDKSFPSQKEWHRHVIKHGSKPYVCELCADSFYTQHQLTNHMKNHKNIRDHVCPECGKGFTHRGLLRQHLQTHNKTKCFCTLCDNIYSNPRSLRKHYVRVHELGQQASTPAKAQYTCQICKITFSTVQDAKQHRKEHKQSNPTERRHVCDICGHHFAYPRNLADHKKTHSNIRDQVCDICGKAFTNANLLNQHKNVHRGEKFVCKACGKDYAHYRGLCRHIAKVHGTNIRDLDALLDKQKLSSSLH